MNSMSPYIRVAMDDIIVPSYVLKERMIWDYELLYIKEGEMEARIDGQSYACQPGDVLVLKPGVRHSLHIDRKGPLRQPHVHFDLVEQENSPEVPVSFIPIEQMNEAQKRWFRPDELSGPTHTLPAHIRLHNPAPFENLLFQLIAEFEMRLPYGELRTKGLLLEMLSLLLRETNLPDQHRNPRRTRLLADVQRYLSLHADRPVTLEELSARFNLNPHRLIGAFKTAFGTTPMLYHARQRHIRACHLLRFSMLTVQEIADRLGFSDIHAFSRAFKNKEGIAPTAYRANQTSS